MKRLVFLLGVSALVLAGAADAKKIRNKSTVEQRRPLNASTAVSRDGALPGKEAPRPSGEPIDTTVLAEFTFDNNGCDPQGWVGVDPTAQSGDYFHIDDFAGLGGGTFGRLVAPQGSQAAWCGARTDAGDEFLCGYSALPGYGNNWNQAFCTRACLAVDTSVAVNYLAAWDSEPGYDITYVEVDNCDDNWTALGAPAYDDIGSGFESVAIPDNLHSGQLRIRFHFTSDGGWSDEDGIWDTDGAFILDSVTVSDAGGVVVPTEDFEDEAPGDLVADDWETCTPPGYGDFSALYPGIQLVQEDPCVSNVTCIWAFINGSTYDYACGGFPAQKVVPYGNSRGQYIFNEVWSPRIPWVGTGEGAELHFDIYKDMALNAVVFFNWHVRSWIDDCPGGWQDRASVGGYGDSKTWQRQAWVIGDLVLPNTDEIQIALGVADMCPFWCGTFGTGDCHSHSPMFDNVSVVRLDANGPVWSVRDIDLFQDTFAEDGTTTGTARADMAIDRAPSQSVNLILPGDSAVVDVYDPDGLATDPHTGTGSAVYAYVTVWPDGTKFGPDVASGDQSNNGYERYPLVDSLVHDGKWWYCVRFDTSFTDGNKRTGPQDDRWAVDLNDDVFVPGDTICFAFCAENAIGARTYYSQEIGATDDMAAVLDNPMEFTILPAGGWLRGGDVLYVDGFDGRGAQPFFEEAFQWYTTLADKVDRYDIRGPASLVGNRPGSRVKSVQNQLLDCYRFIIWNTGNLSEGTIGDGTGDPEKSDDATMLVEFLEGLDEPGGVYFSGDNLANELSGLSGAGAITLRGKYVNYAVTSTDHIQHLGAASPFLYGVVGGIFDHIAGQDELVAFGGCPNLGHFDVISPTGSATLEARYWTGPGGIGSSGGAVVAQQTFNPDSVAAGVVLSGASFHSLRHPGDPVGGDPAQRHHHLSDILKFLGKPLSDPGTGVDPPGRRNHLAQNYPNPFNPTTTIAFELREKARVRVAVYNVAGQRVKLLADDVREPGVVHKLVWDGVSDAGTAVASGVYFYRIEAPGFSRTKKMVLLK